MVTPFLEHTGQEAKQMFEARMQAELGEWMANGPNSTSKAFKKKAVKFQIKKCLQEGTLLKKYGLR